MLASILAFISTNSSCRDDWIGWGLDAVCPSLRCATSWCFLLSFLELKETKDMCRLIGSMLTLLC